LSSILRLQPSKTRDLFLSKQGAPFVFQVYIWVFPKIVVLYPKMDGENNGKPYVLMDDLGGYPPPFSETPI